MPQLFRICGYLVYFYANEGMPTESIHVHVGKKPAQADAKFWITRRGKLLMEYDHINLSRQEYRVITSFIEANIGDVEAKWTVYFGEVRYKC